MELLYNYSEFQLVSKNKATIYSLFGLINSVATVIYGRYVALIINIKFLLNVKGLIPKKIS